MSAQLTVGETFEMPNIKKEIKEILAHFDQYSDHLQNKNNF